MDPPQILLRRHVTTADLAHPHVGDVVRQPQGVVLMTLVKASLTNEGFGMLACTYERSDEVTDLMISVVAADRGRSRLATLFSIIANLIRQQVQVALLAHHASSENGKIELE